MSETPSASPTIGSTRQRGGSVDRWRGRPPPGLVVLGGVRCRSRLQAAGDRRADSVAGGDDPRLATPDAPPTRCGGRRSTIRRSIAWSSSPTGRTCRCRSPACASSRRAPSWASRPGSSFRRRRRCPRSAAADRAEPERSPTSPASAATSSTTRSASTRPGSWTSGASTGAASRPRPPALLASVADYDTALVSLTAEVARTYVDDPHLRGADRAGRAERQAPGGGARNREGALPERRDVGAGSDPGDDAAREHPRHHPAAADRAAAGAQRARARCSGSRRAPSRRCWPGPRTIPKAPAKVAVGVPAEMLRRRPDIRSAELRGRRAVRAHRRRQGRPLSELLAARHRSACAAFNQRRGRRTTSSRPTASSTRSGPRINWPFLNYGRLTNAVRVAGRAVSSSCWSATGTPCSRRRRRSRTR